MLPLTGIDPEALTEMHEFRATTGASVTADALAQQLSADRPPDPAAPVIPAGRSGSPSVRRASTPTSPSGCGSPPPTDGSSKCGSTGTGPELTAELPGGEAPHRAEVWRLPSRRSGSPGAEHSRESGADHQVTAGHLRLSQLRIDGRRSRLGLVGVGERSGESSDRTGYRRHRVPVR